MWKKINSKAGGTANFFMEFKKEFSAGFEKFGYNFRLWTEAYPRQLFIGMIVLIIGSFVISFVLIKPHHKPFIQHNNLKNLPDSSQTAAGLTRKMSTGFDDIIEKTQNISKILELKKRVKALVGKKELSPVDSSTLRNDLDTLRTLSKF
ncbi:hypothetical protein [Mucilaginibacter lappiensis]|uniref:Uncharacterized protein n=1 Tax=Mucilaginibacter lappiensis TaxID=354630 RepID=A0A841JKM8_9SPHI|nr:hypothetical protein [Mucilaginibacter lappiensis]MBB6131507.1 hypothetical protein [Mucilaginibacter lappiensis]